MEEWIGKIETNFLARSYYPPSRRGRFLGYDFFNEDQTCNGPNVFKRFNALVPCSKVNNFNGHCMANPFSTLPF